MSVIQGSCYCGAVRFQLTTPPTMMATCHCSRCRKVGASTFVFVVRDAFDWVAGEAQVECWQPDPPHEYTRCFCRVCGTALGEVNSTADSFPVAANCLDDNTGLSVRFHEFVAEKPDWLVIGDDAKRFDGHPVRPATS